MRGFRAVSTLMLWHVAMVSGAECNGITLPLTSHCCKDGAPDDYGCAAAYKCAKGQCIGPTNKLCTDASADKPGDYVCGATESCGRGNCVGATSTLCGTSGSKMCPPTKTCCGVTAATKNSDMVCNSNMDTCPGDRKSDTYTSPSPYAYNAGGGSSSAAASLGSGALGTTLLAVATAALLRGLLF